MAQESFTYLVGVNSADDTVVGTYSVNSTVYDTGDGADDGSTIVGGSVNVTTVNGTYLYTVVGTTANGVVLQGPGSVNYLVSNAAYAGGSTVSINTTDPYVYCFLEGTKISTPRGEVNIETLKNGDEVLTADGRAVKIRWMGYQTIHNRIGTSSNQAPVKISANAIAPGVPSADLYLTGSHAVLIDDQLINASVLCNGTTIDYVSLKDMPAEFVYWNIETDAHEAVVANGLSAETFVDSPDRQTFDNYNQYVDLYGTERRIPEMSNFRVTATNQLPEALKASLGIAEVETDWAEVVQNGSCGIALKQG